ncbi:MAG: GNAT family N-acetyltransferase [Alphaproteobacteria bacterium]|nr:GNAT family N-acetyltransferase [Alphaproteobacteria bacterium]
MSGGRATLTPLRETDFEAAGALARSVWHAHYDPMIGAAQVEYMLARRFTDEALRLYLEADDRWFEMLRVGDADAGYCSYALSPAPGELKLEQLYVLPSLHGRGFGALMLRQVEVRARTLSCDMVVLQVAKRNAGSIAFYERAGYSIREPILIEIGDGYVMDDWVMAKRLA